MKFTLDQQKVIDLRNRNLLVSAAAGSGKTAVLVERIIGKITDQSNPIDIDQLLIVTFTKAAAAEMRDRIASALEKRLEEFPEDVHLQRQQTLLLNAQITTIDSFCMFVIRQFFYRIDLEPDFRIGEEGEFQLLKKEVLGEVLEKHYEAGEEDFYLLTESLATGKHDQPLEDLILSLYEFSMSNPWPRPWLMACVAPYEIKSFEEWEQVPMGQALLAYCKTMTKEWANLLELCLGLSRKEDGPKAYKTLLEKELEMMETLARCETYPEFYQEMQRVSFGRLPSISAKNYKGDLLEKEFVKETRTKIKDSLKSLVNRFFFQEPTEMLEDLNKNRNVVAKLVGLCLEFWEAFSEKKREKNLLDFGDLEHFALQILVDEESGEPTATALELQKMYDEIMIDEYQDSNYVQEAILTAVSGQGQGKKNLFMVGDVKQSIYRFRMARPELFMEKYERYPTEDSEEQRINLHMNFRSRPQVLSTVNDIFYGIMAKDLGNVAYDEEAALYPGMEFPESKDNARESGSESGLEFKNDPFQTEVLVADKELFSEDREDPENDVIAVKILQLLETQMVTDKESGNLRPVEYGDIVILMRGLGEKASNLIQTLGEYGIPAISTTANGYFSAIEVQTALNYLRLIDNPKQDIPMAAVLASPIGNLNGEEMANIRIQFRKLPFYHAVFLYGEEGVDEALRRKIQVFLEELARYRERVSDTPIHELLSGFLQESGYLDYVLALPGGKARRGNLEMLLEKAIDYENTSFRGLFHFISYINQLEKYQVDYGEAEEEGLSASVRIMTIHKSKGLEFPVVFLAGMGKQFNRSDERSRLVLHPTLGIGMDLVDLDLRTRIPSLSKQTLARQIQVENMGEELRVLYVALTRAKEKLILTGSLKKGEEKCLAYENQIFEEGGKMSFLSRLGALHYFDWVLPALLKKPHMYQVQRLGEDDLSLEQFMGAVEEEVSRQQLLSRLASVDSDMQKEVEKCLDFIYPYVGEEELKTKLTVSELKHRAMDLLSGVEEDTPLFSEEIPIPYIPAFMQDLKEENIFALRGTAHHRVLECLDFSADFSTLDLQIEAMREEGRLEEKLHMLISLPWLQRFLGSPLAKRMQEAARLQNLQREKPFVMGKPAKELMADSDSQVMVLVQGIVDVLFEEEKDLVLVDYKTDFVKNKEELVSRYRTQMDLYQEAVERATGRKVKEKIIYSFGLQEEIYV